MLIKICFYNLMISIFGFGSGAVFFNYVYDYYVVNGIISVEQFNFYVGLTNVLPGAITVKILTLSAIESLNIVGIIIALTIFVIPTMVFIYLTAQFIKIKRLKVFFDQLGILFVPVLIAVVLVVLSRLTFGVIDGIDKVIYLVVAIIITYFIDKRYQMRGFVLVLIINFVLYNIII